MAPSINEAKNWLHTLRQHWATTPHDRNVTVLIAQHATDCPCRELSRPGILALLRTQELRGDWHLNRAASATKNSLMLVFKDPDPEMDENRRKVELTIVFPESEHEVPIVISAWREGSPHPREGNCWRDPDEPPCLQRNRIRGRIP